jgi:rod shape-determining protein MreD
MKKLLFGIVTLWAVLFLQSINNHLLGGSWFSMNCVLIVVLFFGLSRGPLAGETFGLFSGLLVDASSLGLMGMHTLLYTLAGYASGMLSRQLDETKVWTQTIFSFAVSFIYIVFYFGLTYLFSAAERPATWTAFTQPLLNALLAPLLFWLMRRWADAWGLFPVES